MANKHAGAMYRMGQLYIEDRLQDGVVIIKKDLITELNWYKKAAILYYPQALNALVTKAERQQEVALYVAKMYELGEGIPKNIIRAMEYYEKASNLGAKSAFIEWCKKAIAKGDVDAIAKMRSIAEKDPEFAYEVGKVYEEYPVNIQTSCIYYSIAMRRNHKDAKTRLHDLALAGNTDAQYALHQYYKDAGKVLEAVNYSMQAAEQKHEWAITYLRHTTFSIDIYRHIASRYEKGEGVRKNIAQAIVFYTKAGELGDKEAALQSAQLYQLDPDVINREKAFACYMRAAELGHQDALVPLERLGEEMAPSKQLQLSRMYGRFFNNEKMAYWSAKGEEALGAFITIN